MENFDYLGKPIEYIDGYTEYQSLFSTDVLARLIYSEACGESYKGKQAVAYTVWNRLILDNEEFGLSIIEICTNKSNRFDGMKSSLAHKPDRSSQNWYDSCYITSIGASNDNPIGGCLWFNTHDKFESRTRTVGSDSEYTFDGGKTYKKVVEKYIIGRHTFFRVEGSEYEF